MRNQLLYIGVTQRTAPCAFREFVHCDADGQRRMLRYFARRVDGCLVLSTCERQELYISDRCITAASAMAFLAESLQVSIGVLSRYASVRSGVTAARRLLSVAAGLESRIVGEPQILGQVRKAYSDALETRSVDPILASLGRSALRAGKRVRHETHLGRRDLSIVKLTVEHLESRLGSLSGRRVVVLGSGGLAREVVDRLAVLGTVRVIVVARDMERARAIATQAGVRAMFIGQLADVVGGADVLVVCTSADRFLVDAQHLGGAVSGGIEVVDLSWPRNVDPLVSEITGVTLCDMDHLVGSARRSHVDIDDAERIVRDELAAFVRWRRERAVAPIIEKLGRTRVLSGVRPIRDERKSLHESITRLKRGVVA